MIICPHCQSEESRIAEVRDHQDGVLRYRACRSCGKRFPTMEVVVENQRPERGQYVPIELHRPQITQAVATVEPEPEPGAEPEPAVAAKASAPKKRIERYVATIEDIAEMNGAGSLVAPVPDLLVRWWNESRKQKHGTKAVWSKTAFAASVGRVAALPQADQLDLVQAGVEAGWQQLKSDYLFGRAPANPLLAAHGAWSQPAQGPRNPQMRRALEVA